MARDFERSESDNMLGETDNTMKLSNGDDVSIFVWKKFESGSGRQTAAASGPGPGNGNLRNFQFGNESNEAVQLIYRNSGNSAWHIFASSAGDLPTSGWTNLGMSYTMSTGSSIVVYAEGVDVGGSWTTGNGNSSPYTGGSGYGTYIGTYHAPGEGTDGLLSNMVMFKGRLLSDNEHAALSHGVNPFAFTSDEMKVNCPLWGDHDPEPNYADNSNRFDLQTTIPQVKDNPPVELLENYL